MQRLIFTSKSNIVPSDHQSTISQIAAGSRIKNADLGLTGAWISTGRYFVEVLEGSAESIQNVMAHIYNDPRHQEIKVVDISSITCREFPDWQMIYKDPSHFVWRNVAKLLLNDVKQKCILREAPLGVSVALDIALSG